MKKVLAFILAIFLFHLIPAGSVCSAESQSPLVGTPANNEGKGASPGRDAFSGTSLISAIEGLKISGGISAGDFYLTNAEPDSSSNEVLLSNFLLEIAPKDDTSPLGFVAAFGETSTPTLLDSPENNRNFDFEYGSLILRLLPGLSLEGGLLKPCSGYEDTYTYNNPNIVLGVLASQQPYNAYGGRLTYSLKGVDLHLAYYTTRLNRDEYCINGRVPGDVWEVAADGKVSVFSFCVYHYHLQNLKSLTGFVLEHQSKNLLLAFNVDFWKWNESMDDYYNRSYAVGGAFYAVPSFGKISLPIRLEFIDQGGSKIYIADENTNVIYAITVTPTYHFDSHSYLRAEAAYVYADKGFAVDNGQLKNSRVYLAAEMGYLF